MLMEAWFCCVLDGAATLACGDGGVRCAVDELLFSVCPRFHRRTCLKPLAGGLHRNDGGHRCWCRWDWTLWIKRKLSGLRGGTLLFAVPTHPFLRMAGLVLLGL